MDWLCYLYDGPKVMEFNLNYCKLDTENRIGLIICHVGLGPALLPVEIVYQWGCVIETGPRSPHLSISFKIIPELYSCLFF